MRMWEGYRYVGMKHVFLIFFLLLQISRTGETMASPLHVVIMESQEIVMHKVPGCIIHLEVTSAKGKFANMNIPLGK